MIELAKEIEKKYIEELTSKYPLHKFYNIFFLLIAIYIYSKEKMGRIINEIGKIKLNFIFDFENGFFSTISVNDVIVAIVISYFISVIHKKTIMYLYSLLFQLSKSLPEYKKKLEDMGVSENYLDIVDKESLIKETEEKYRKVDSGLKLFYARNEITLTFFVCIIYGVSNFIYIDWILTFIFISYILFNSWKSFKFYISEYFPYYIAVKSLRGQKINFGNQD